MSVQRHSKVKQDPTCRIYSKKKNGWKPKLCIVQLPLVVNTTRFQWHGKYVIVLLSSAICNGTHFWTDYTSCRFTKDKLQFPAGLQAYHRLKVKNKNNAILIQATQIIKGITICISLFMTIEIEGRWYSPSVWCIRWSEVLTCHNIVYLGIYLHFQILAEKFLTSLSRY